MLIRIRRSVTLMGVCCALAALSAGSAAADGTCGRHNSDGPKACPVGSPGTYTGTLEPAYDPYPFYAEKDYYVFHARAGTKLSVVINDTEDPSCSMAYLICGNVSAELDNSQGDTIADSKGDGGLGDSTVTNGIAVPATLTHVLRRAGTYYLILSGALGRDISLSASSTELANPYSFTITASPNVSAPGAAGAHRRHRRHRRRHRHRHHHHRQHRRHRR